MLRHIISASYANPFGQFQELGYLVANADKIDFNMLIDTANNTGMGIGYGPTLGFIGLMTTGIDPLTKQDLNAFQGKDGYYYYPVGATSYKISTEIMSNIMRGEVPGNNVEQYFVDNVQMVDTPPSMVPIGRAIMRTFLPTMERTLNMADWGGVQPKKNVEPWKIISASQDWKRLYETYKKETASLKPDDIDGRAKWLQDKIKTDKEFFNTALRVTDTFYIPSMSSVLRNVDRNDLGYKDAKRRVDFMKLFGFSPTVTVSDPVRLLNTVGKAPKAAGEAQKDLLGVAMLLIVPELSFKQFEQ